MRFPAWWPWHGRDGLARRLEAKAGEPEMAAELVSSGVGMVLGLPLPLSRAGAPRGALCLMFGHARPIKPDEMAAYVGMAQLGSFGLRMAEVCRENELLTSRVTHMSTTDALTGAANRATASICWNLNRAARRYQLPVALIMFDIDRFKAINDRYGHAVGDAVIRTVADAARGPAHQRCAGAFGRRRIPDHRASYQRGRRAQDRRKNPRPHRPDRGAGLRPRHHQPGRGPAVGRRSARYAGGAGGGSAGPCQTGRAQLRRTGDGLNGMLGCIRGCAAVVGFCFWRPRPHNAALAKALPTLPVHADDLSA
ncbi:GGDEF domain-containing protein [Massilia sp. B-10]|nr:GGDEF domain-containing protein [Massilia sp. B-10]